MIVRVLGALVRVLDDVSFVVTVGMGS